MLTPTPKGITSVIGANHCIVYGEDDPVIFRANPPAKELVQSPVILILYVKLQAILLRATNYKVYSNVYFDIQT